MPPANQDLSNGIHCVGLSVGSPFVILCKPKSFGSSVGVRGGGGGGGGGAQAASSKLPQFRHFLQG